MFGFDLDGDGALSVCLDVICQLCSSESLQYSQIWCIVMGYTSPWLSCCLVSQQLALKLLIGRRLGATRALQATVSQCSGRNVHSISVFLEMKLCLYIHFVLFYTVIQSSSSLLRVINEFHTIWSKSRRWEICGYDEKPAILRAEMVLIAYNSPENGLLFVWLACRCRYQRQL